MGVLIDVCCLLVVVYIGDSFVECSGSTLGLELVNMRAGYYNRGRLSLAQYVFE